MKDYIKESIYLFGEDIRATVFSPENKGLQKTDQGYTRPEKEYADILHYMFGKILWVEKREGPTLIQLFHYYAPE